MSLRRSLQLALQRLSQYSGADGAACAQQLRGFARMPAGAAESYAAKFPARRTPRSAAQNSSAANAEAQAAPVQQQAAAAGEAAAAEAASGGAAAANTTAAPAAGTVEAIVGETQRESARVATAFMFPWERRQMEGGKLKTWEKFYWSVFALAMASLVFNRVKDGFWEKPKPKVDEEKEAKKEEMARMVLAGRSIVDEGEDPFRGMSPREIQEYVEKVTGAKSDDPFEGMTPEEINEYVAKHGMPAGMQ